MKINMFEGARRIAKIISVLWVIGGSYGIYSLSEPYISIQYSISSPEQEPVRCEDRPSMADDNYAWELIDVKTKNGAEAHAEFFFMATVTDSGQELVPYKVDQKTGQWWCGSSSSSEVSDYTKRVTNAFVLPKVDEEWIDSQWRQEKIKNIGAGVLLVIGGLALFWGLTWVVGWVVRGFLGIPSGKDSREE